MVHFLKIFIIKWNFNSAGHNSGKDGIQRHIGKFYLENYTPYDEVTMIPTGKISPTKGTPIDLSVIIEINYLKCQKLLTSKHQELFKLGDKLKNMEQGYDHNYCDDNYSKISRKVCEIKDPESGRQLNLWTNQPGVQFYTG